MLRFKVYYQFSVLGVTVVLCVVNLIMFTHKMTVIVQNQQQHQQHLPLPYCFANSSMGLVDEGVWEPLPELTERYYQTRRELDKFIRISMGWAPVLHLSNLRYVVVLPTTFSQKKTSREIWQYKKEVLKRFRV